VQRFPTPGQLRDFIEKKIKPGPTEREREHGTKVTGKDPTGCGAGKLYYIKKIKTEY